MSARKECYIYFIIYLFYYTECPISITNFTTMRHCRVTFKIVTRPIDQSDCWKLTWGIIKKICDMTCLTRWDLYDLHDLIFLSHSQLTVVFHQHGSNRSLRIYVAFGFLYHNKRYNQWIAIHVYIFNINSCIQHSCHIFFQQSVRLMKILREFW